MAARLPRKRITEPWFSAIVDGRKTVEGRVNRGFWHDTATVGTVLHVYNERGEAAKVRVVGRRPAATFGDLYATCGVALVPDDVWVHYAGVERGNADALYAAILSGASYPVAETIASRGVVGVELEVLEDNVILKDLPKDQDNLDDATLSSP
jgi:ASC-1-like (ASCH) protein